jgi:sphinganine-1-phosphate aldolase
LIDDFDLVKLDICPMVGHKKKKPKRKIEKIKNWEKKKIELKMASSSSSSSPIIDRVSAQWKKESWLSLLEHGIAAGAVLYVAKGVYDRGLKNSIESAAIGVLRAVPGGASVIEAEQQKVVAKIEEFVLANNDEEEHLKNRLLPENGVDRDELFERMQGWRDKEHDYRGGRAFGGVYSDDHEHEKFLARIYELYQDSNALYPGVFPGLRKFEAEVVRMCVDIFQGGEEGCGTMTSGGTESILMAVKAYREWARKKMPHVSRPNIVAPQSAHAAFPKACYYLGIEYRMVPVREDVDFRVDPAAMAAAIDANTIALVGSAPAFPQGVIDPIEELGQLALKHNIGLHVDCCLGGFVVPFLRRLGLVTRAYDFSVPGVTSISADIHKYGLGPKGTSVILHASAERRKMQFYKFTEWSGGIYATASAAGSRPGYSVAAAWATLMSHGWSGYMRHAENIYASWNALVQGIPKIDGLRVLGPPDACVVAFISVDPTVNTLKLADALAKTSSWQVNRLQKPVCLQLQIGDRSNFDAAQFLQDLAACCQAVRERPDDFNDGLAAVYSMAADMGDRNMVGSLMEDYLSALYKV